MPTPLRVLMVEDSESDASLILRQLGRAGYQVEHVRVETAAQMQAELDTKNWEIITADYSLPQFNGPAALELLLKRGLDIPFIVISGEVTDEMAVALMKTGAQDFLLKDNLSRLGAVLERELVQAQKRREHQAASAALVESAAQFELVFNSSSDLQVLTRIEPGEHFTIARFNQAFLDFYQKISPDARLPIPGMDRDSFLATGLGMSPKGIADERSLFLRALAERRAQHYEVETHFSGSNLALEVSISPVPDAKGECHYILWSARDITERKRIQNELNESNQRFSNAFEYAGNGMALNALDGRYLKVNQALCDMLGYSMAELTGMRYQDITHPDDLAQDEQSTRSLLQGECESSQVQKRYLHKQGNLVWGLLNLSVVRDDQGQPLYSIAQVSDISELKKAEEALRRSEKDQRTILETSMNGFWVVDLQGYLREVNQIYCRMSGYERSELLGMNISDLEILEARAETAAHIALVMQKGADRFESRHRRKDGSLFDVEVSVQYQANDGGRMVVFLQDISERNQARQALLAAQAELEQRVIDRTRELEAANLALEKAASAKDEFMASMSHELRTPLTGILGLSEALQMVTYGDLNDRQRNAIKNIETSGRHLLTLINDILDLSKIEAGRFDLQFETCLLGDICQASLQLTRGFANQKQQKVTFSMEPAAILIRADARRLKQMLVNLLSNAIKFTPEHGKLGLEVHGSLEERQIRITVWDEGIGIQSEDLPRLFQPFVQLDSSLARQAAGTGLGLSLVSRLAELHAGRVEVESSPGKGSRFTIVLPWGDVLPLVDLQKRPGTGSLNPSRSTSAAAPLILMVDDNQMVLDLVSDFLTAQNYRVFAAQSGLEFLDCLEQVAPDLVLMDIQMPGLNGMELIRRIRSSQQAEAVGVPIIAVTALAMSGDRERCLAAGANAYLSKPVELKELVKLIEQLLARTGDPAGAR